jgi:non-reducing end alpha-L-arabinofuranosidase
MKTKKSLAIMLGLALTVPVASLIVAAQAGAGRRPEGPCDIYAAGNAPCVAAHSTTRALYASYNGPLYQVKRQSDGKTLDIGVVQPSATDSGGYADAAAQDTFCANTYCWISIVYDQSGHKNDLFQAPPGPAGTQMAMGGFNNLPVADWAPVTIMGHKVYGIFIVPGMGLRNDNPHFTAVDDQAEGQYWVVNGHHYNGGCCFDYGNGETDSRDDGNGTMETTYFGNATPWYHGPPPGPWIMTDQENNLVGCVNTNSSSKVCDLPIITWRFVTATADGEPHHWRTLGGDAQQGELKVQFDGGRVNNTYDPMRKQGAIILGNGGDNSNGSQGTVYEAAMTMAGTFPSAETQQKVQANIVAAKYDVQRVSVAPAAAVNTPPGLQTFSPGSSQETTVTFKNVGSAPATGVKLSLAVPAGWTSVVSGGTETAKTIADPVAPGASVSATFKVTSGSAAFNGDIIGNVSWTANGFSQSDSMSEKVRNVSPIKINEFAGGTSDSFIELYNSGDKEVDLSGWTMTEHPNAQAIFSTIKMPAGAKVAQKGFYLLGLANSGLAVAARKGDSTIYVRSVAGMNVGDTIEIDTGSGKETRKIANLGTAAGSPTTIWEPLPEGPILNFPVGTTKLPYTPAGGRGGGGGNFAEVGQKLAIGHGATYPFVANHIEKYEIVTVTAVGKAGAQTYLAANASKGDTSIRVRSAANFTVGDQIVLDIDSKDHGVETVTVKSIGGAAADGGGRGGRGGGGATIELEAPLKFNHASNLPFNNRGTGISFEPATAVAHISGEPLLALGTGITLDSPLAGDHEINAVVRDEKVTTAGYQGPPAPDMWFGGPVIADLGAMILRDAAGLVVDSLNFGRVIDPWASQGYQATSPGDGCTVPAPSAGGRGGFGGRGGPAGPALASSTGRFPDGKDTGSNCGDFQRRTSLGLAADSAAGANNIKVSSTAGFSAGQTIAIDNGANRETATIATVGTAGATTVSTATAIGATTIPVASTAGFNVGQTITIDSGANIETAVIASISGGGRGGFGGGGRGGAPGAGLSITVSGALTKAHEVGAQVSGSGITFSSALAKAHAAGARLGGSGPTPGAANQAASSQPGGRG